MNNNNNDNNDNRIELIGDEDDIELGDADFERPFPDSDEAIRALQDIAESVDELEAECYRLRAELKTSNAERDEARQENKELLWMLDKRRSSPDCHDLHHEFEHQNHGDICPVLTQYNTFARKYGV